MNARVQFSAQDQHFHPDHYFLGLAMQASQAKKAVRIEHPVIGSVIIDPLRQRFFSLCEDLEQLCRCQASELQLQPHSEQIPEQHASQDLEELLWMAGYHASEGRLPHNVSKYDVLELDYWPNLTRLPATPDIMRLCALLSRKAHSLHLARKLLEVGEEEAYRFYCAAMSAGMLRQLSHTLDIGDLDDRAEPAPASHPAAENPAASKLGLTLRHLWSKLTGR